MILEPNGWADAGSFSKAAERFLFCSNGCGKWRFVMYLGFVMAFALISGMLTNMLWMIL